MGAMAEHKAIGRQGEVPDVESTPGQSNHRDGPTKPRRRFAPQLEETSVRSSHKPKANPTPPKSPADTTTKPRRKFVPQLLEETTVRSSRKKHTEPSPSPPPPTPSLTDAGGADRPRSRFVPQLIETAQRTRRRADPETRQKSETDFSPGDALHFPRHPGLKQRGASFSQEADEDPDGAPTSRFSYANLTKSRRSSVRKPTLECIHSSGSESEKVPSLSYSRSAQSEEPEHHKNVRHVRESCDERFTGYLLAHAARLAERQLQEQAMTAYLNENRHEPVDHFAGSREGDDSGSEEGIGLLSQVQSSTNLARHKGAPGWDPHEKERHQDALERLREEHRATKKRRVGGQPEEHDDTHDVPSNHWLEIRRMREAARPPLLGGTLVFPVCPSPKATRIDAYQRPRCRKYDRESPPTREHSGLWLCRTASPVRTRKNSVQTPGLWGGYCDASTHEAAVIPGRLMQSGLLTPGTSTPTHELADSLSAATLHQSLLSPFMARASKSTGAAPVTPPPSVTEMSSIDSALAQEAALDMEFPDSFITQVYNYVSLGYPALAQKFDEELAKISKIPVDEIRREDGECDAKGFLGAPEQARSATGLGTAPHAGVVRRGMHEEQHDACGRWRALRLYIREWGRQEGRMQEYEVPPGAQIARRGSWRA